MTKRPSTQKKIKERGGEYINNEFINNLMDNDVRYQLRHLEPHSKRSSKKKKHDLFNLVWSMLVCES